MKIIKMVQGSTAVTSGWETKMGSIVIPQYYGNVFFKDSHKYIHPFLHNYTIVGLKSNNYLGYVVIHHGVFQLSHRAVDDYDVMRCSTESDIRTIS